MKIAEHQNRPRHAEAVATPVRRSIETETEVFRASIDKRLRQSGEELLPEEIRRYELNRQLLASMSEQMAYFQAENRPVRVNQLRGLLRLAEFLAEGGNEWNTGYIRQPTGAGKTVLYGIIARLLNTKTIILVPTTVLLTQTVDELVERVGIPRENIGIIGGQHYDVGKGKNVLVGTYQTHLRHMGSNKRYTSEVEGCSLVICDEAHKSLGQKSTRSLSELGLGNPGISMVPELQNENRDARLILGFTATTELRSKSVSKYYHELIAEEHYDELAAARILVPFDIVKAEKSVVYEDEVSKIRDRDEIAILKRENVYEKLVRAFIEEREKRKEPLYAAAFCANHKECQTYADVASRFGLRCQIVTGYEKKKDVDAVAKAEERLLQGKIDQIITVELLTIGWDCRPLNTAVMARATQSPARIIQPAGRTSRAFDSASDDRYAGKLHTPYKKTSALIIEADWSVQSRSLATAIDAAAEITGGAPPVDLAEALAMVGEEPDKFVSRSDGQKLRYERRVNLEDGRAELYGKVIITLPAYARIPEKGINLVQLNELVGEAIIQGRIRSVPNLRGGAKSLVLYREEDLDRIVDEWKVAAEQEKDAEELRKKLEKENFYTLDRKTDEVAIAEEGNRIAIGIRGIGRLPAMKDKNAPDQEIRAWLAAKRLLPINYRVCRTHSKDRLRVSRALAYWKDEVRRDLSEFPQENYILDQMTDEVSIPEERNRVAIGIQGILRLPGVSGKSFAEDSIREWLSYEHVTPVTGYRILRMNPKSEIIERARVYWKDLVLSNLPRLPEAMMTGSRGRFLPMPDGSLVFQKTDKKGDQIRQVSTFEIFCKRWDVNPKLLQEVAEARGIKPISLEMLQQYEGMSGFSETVFWTDELLTLLSVITRNDQTVDLPSESGEKTQVRLAITLEGFAAVTGTTTEHVKKNVEAAKLSPVTLSDCVPLESAKIMHTPLTENTSMARVFLPDSNQNWDLLCSTDEEETLVVVYNGSHEKIDTVYWLEELEKLQ